jgi:hypothetical protein
MTVYFLWLYRAGCVKIRPSFYRIMEDGDEIIVLAEDNDTYKAEPPIDIPDIMQTVPRQPLPRPPQKILLCGWRRDIHDILHLLDNLSPPHTEVTMANRLPVEDRDKCLIEAGRNPAQFQNIHLVHVRANMVIRRHVDALPIEKYDCLLVFSDSDEDNILASDSTVLASVLMLRGVELSRRSHVSLKDLSKTRRGAIKGQNTLLKYDDRVHCIAEILDARTQKTIAINRAIALSSDYIFSNQLVSRMMAMVSENRHVNAILNDLLGDSGNMFDVLPSSRCVYDMLFWGSDQAIVAHDEDNDNSVMRI